MHFEYVVTFVFNMIYWRISLYRLILNGSRVGQPACKVLENSAAGLCTLVGAPSNTQLLGVSLGWGHHVPVRRSWCRVERVQRILNQTSSFMDSFKRSDFTVRTLSSEGLP